MWLLERFPSVYKRNYVVWQHSHLRGWGIDADVDPNGWVICEMWWYAERQFAPSRVEVEHFVVIFDDDGRAIRIPLTDDEYHGFPTMPLSWTIPF